MSTLCWIASDGQYFGQKFARNFLLHTFKEKQTSYALGFVWFANAKKNVVTNVDLENCKAH